MIDNRWKQTSWKSMALFETCEPRRGVLKAHGMHLPVSFLQISWCHSPKCFKTILFLSLLHLYRKEQCEEVSNSKATWNIPQIKNCNKQRSEWFTTMDGSLRKIWWAEYSVLDAGSSLSLVTCTNQLHPFEAKGPQPALMALGFPVALVVGGSVQNTKCRTSLKHIKWSM